MTEKEKDDLIEALRDYYRDSIFVTDGNGNVIFVNDVASQRVGLPMDELRGETCATWLKKAFTVIPP